MSITTAAQLCTDTLTWDRLLPEHYVNTSFFGYVFINTCLRETQQFEICAKFLLRKSCFVQQQRQYPYTLNSVYVSVLMPLVSYIE